MTQGLYAHMNNKTIKKYLKQRRSGGVAGVVEQLHRKHMALNSNSTTT
jgi:hypothetical protein